MSSRENRTQMAVEIPIETKKALKDADGPMWKIVDEGVRMTLGLDEGSTEAALENRLEEIRQEREEISDQLDHLQDRFENLEEMEEDVEERLQNVREKKRSYKSHLDSVLGEMEADPQSRPVIAWMEQLRDASMTEYGSDSKENIRRVIEDLRQRSAEQGRTIRPDRLTRTSGASLNNNNPVSADGGADEPDLRVLNRGDSDE